MSDPRPATDDRPAALPDDAILLHIGVHKTGTTSLQTQLRAARPELAARGISYPGNENVHAHHRWAMALVGTVFGWAPRDPEHDLQTWQRFADDVSATPGKVLVSSEFFCQAKDDHAKRAVETLGKDRVHVLVGFRHLGELLPSSWQQYLKTGRSTTYEAWLKHTLGEPLGRRMTPSFWGRNDVPVVLKRWVDLLGPDRVTVVVADLSDRDRLPRTVTDLLGVPEAVLKVDTDDLRSNRSMTAEEAELIRRVNVWARRNLTSERYQNLMRGGGATHMVESRRPTPEEHKLGLPAWAHPRVAEIAATHVAAIKASGAQVVGDLDSLVRPLPAVEVPEVSAVPIDAAVEAMIGVLERAENLYDKPTLREFRTRQLAKEVGRRTKRVSRRMLHPREQAEVEETPEPRGGV